jgi:methyltransferase (TIGR00027 family)
MKTPIEHISDTARWVAVYRAMETERPDAHFRDPYARLLAGGQGEKIVQTLPKGVASAWAIIVRTCVFDEIILRAVQTQGVDTILNLASGLDTRPYRLPLPTSLKWVEVDLPDILTYKEKKLAGVRPVCSLEMVKMDLKNVTSRQTLFNRVRAISQRVLVVSEGLSPYLTSDQMTSLAQDLSAQSTFQWWLLDLISPFALQQIQKLWKKQLSTGRFAFHFAPVEGAAFFNPYGWKVKEVRSSVEEGHRLKREMPYAWFWRFLGKIFKRKQEIFRNTYIFALLERI